MGEIVAVSTFIRPDFFCAREGGRSLIFFLQYAYTEEYEQRKGKGSFPAHLTPGYKMSKKASEQASNVSIKIGAVAWVIQ